MWRKSLEPALKGIIFDDERLLGRSVNLTERKLFLLNVHLPYNNTDKFDLYILYIGTICSISEDYDMGEIIVMGGFIVITGM